MAYLRIEGLVKRYGAVTAVDHVDVDIREGSLTGILGPSGCGKTTLLRCIAGLLIPDGGRISIGGKDVTHWEPYRRNLGMVFQRPSMFPHMTAFQNIAWGLRLRRWPKERIPGRVRDMLRLVHLEGMEDRAFSQLSGGQAQRVVIARALAPEPDLLLLDEPLSSLDAKLRDELKLEIADIHRKTGCTTILVTHDQAEALTIADNVLLMQNGRIVQAGAPLDIYRRPDTLFSADFIGVNNLWPGVVLQPPGQPPGQAIVALDGTSVVLAVSGASDGLPEGSPVWICARADDIDVVEPGHSSTGSPAANTVAVDVERSSLTGAAVIIEGRLAGRPIRIHAGGRRRFDYLNLSGSRILCDLGAVSLIRRDVGE